MLFLRPIGRPGESATAVFERFLRSFPVPAFDCFLLSLLYMAETMVILESYGTTISKILDSIV